MKKIGVKCGDCVTDAVMDYEDCEEGDEIAQCSVCDSEDLCNEHIKKARAALQDKP